MSELNASGENSQARFKTITIAQVCERFEFTRGATKRLLTETTITKSVILAASRETIWEYLTDKDKLGEWFFQAEENLQTGQDYCLVQHDENGNAEKMVWGKVLEMTPPKKLIYTFTFQPLGGAMTTVTWELQEAQDGMKLSLTHSGIEEAAGEAAMNLLLALDVGWAKHTRKLRGGIMTAGE